LSEAKGLALAIPGRSEAAHINARASANPNPLGWKPAATRGLRVETKAVDLLEIQRKEKRRDLRAPPFRFRLVGD